MSALSANDPSRAIELLRQATTYEFAQPGITFYGSGRGAFGAMYQIYVRGAAYRALHKPAAAAAVCGEAKPVVGLVRLNGPSVDRGADGTRLRAKFAAARRSTSANAAPAFMEWTR